MRPTFKSRLGSFALAALFGLSVPVVEMALRPAIAIDEAGASGTFVNDNTSIELFYNLPSIAAPEERSYLYIERNLATDDVFALLDGKPTPRSTADREEYIWYRGDYAYIVAWRPSDPDFIRVEIYDPYGVQIFNRLFER